MGEKKNILIIHGWMHSASIYKRLKDDLEKDSHYSVFLYELSGFGNQPAKYEKDIIVSYASDLKKYLEINKIDIVIAHSLGGNVLLRATENINVNRILLSPEYKGIKLLKLAIPFLPIGVPLLKLLKKRNVFTTFIIKLLSLFTINSWRAITSDVVDSARKANSKVAIELIREMYNDNYETIGKKINTYLIIGEKDRVITREKMNMLQNDLVNCKLIIIKNIGHTAVLEDYDSLYKNIIHICEEIDNGS